MKSFFDSILSLLRYREKGYNIPQIPLDSLHTKIAFEIQYKTLFYANGFLPRALFTIALTF